MSFWGKMKSGKGGNVGGKEERGKKRGSKRIK
jgi:hypothetical protein